MKRTSFAKIIPVIILAASVLVAFLSRFGFMGPFRDVIRLVIYLSIYTIWGISTQHRMLAPNIKRLFGCISLLMIMWMSVRTIKISLDTSYPEHYLWYLYYIPMIFMPFLVVVIAMLLHKEEDYRLPKWINIFCAIGVIIVGLVLTNDYHQLIFVFPDGKPFSSFDYSYGWCYVLIALWRASCIIAALVILFLRCRLPNKGSRILAPMIPLVIIIIYYAVYVFNIPIFYRMFGDLSVIESLLTISMLELCIKTGLIPSNTQYTRLFKSSTINAHITDKEHNILLSSNSAGDIPREVLEKAVDSPVILDGGLRLSGAHINNGYVMWCDDVSDVMETVNELNRVNRTLTVKRERVQNEYAISRKEHQTKEQKRLYHEVLEKTEKEIRLYAELAGRLAQEKDPNAIRRLACHIAVVCAYIKRRISLVFSIGDSNEISAEQLGICICKDSLPCIEKCGAKCEYISEYNGNMTFEQVIGLYEIFNKVTMYSLDTLKSISVKLREADAGVLMLLEIICDDDLSCLADDDLSVEYADGRWLLTAGGAAYG